MVSQLFLPSHQYLKSNYNNNFSWKNAEVNLLTRSDSTQALTMKRRDNWTMKRQNNYITKRRQNNYTTKRQNNLTTKRQNNWTMKRCNTLTMKRWIPLFHLLTGWENCRLILLSLGQYGKVQLFSVTYVNLTKSYVFKVTQLNEPKIISLKLI